MEGYTSTLLGDLIDTLELETEVWQVTGADLFLDTSEEMGDTIKLAQYLGVVEAVVAILEVAVTPVGPVMAAKGIERQTAWISVYPSR